MYKMAKKNGMGALKNSIVFGSGVLTEKISHGMKYAGSRMGDMSDYIRKNPNLSMARHRISKNPTGSALTIAGIGLAVLGVMSLLRK